jgi:hypothetical protein
MQLPLMAHPIVTRSYIVLHKLGVIDDVRTFNTKYDKVKRVAHEVARSLDNEDGKQILANIRTLRQRFEPEVLAKDEPVKAHRAKSA